MQVRDLPDISGCLSLDRTQTVADALALMSGASAVIVMDAAANRPAGIFTERDLVRCHTRFPDKPLSHVVLEQVMTENLIVAEPEDSVDDAMAMMMRGRIRHLPVVENQQITGIIALEDLVKAHVGALTRELHYLKDYITDLQDAAHD
ncbi:MAG TPA: CBS domain-containing protein [Desulfobacteraceae bacterium]|nr:CBS domain-containing protein [Desulfobacteraceae bacterium]|tara:strand:- start:40 stop:483 length:444 start_codon:yes stop_codon:yes gene_type:complete